jgi:YD repeat-containing protein
LIPSFACLEAGSAVTITMGVFMSSFFRSCNARILRQIWPLVFLFVSNGAYAISVTTSAVTMLSTGNGQFTISWTGAGFASQVEQSTNGGSSWVAVATGYYNSGSVTFTRAPGIWWYRIKYWATPSSNPQYTATYPFTVNTPPATPTFDNLLRTSGSSSFYVAASWPSTATRFEWQERENNGTWTNLSYTTAGFDRTDRASGIWGYQVRACNDAGCSAYSLEMVMYVAIAPGIPASISVPGTTYGSLTVSWGAASGSVTKYDLDIRNGSGSYTDQYDGSLLTTPVTVSAAGTYYFRVRACRTTVTYTNCSDWRTSSAVAASLPPIPGGLSVPASNTSGAYSVSWNGISGVSGYTLQERKGSREWATVQDSSATSKNFADKGNSKYSYRVRSCTSLGCSAYTAAETVSVVRSRTGAATEIFYEYDALGRLQFVEDSVNSSRDYDYDAAGNRTAVAEGVESEDEDPIEPERPPAPTGLTLQGPFSQAGGYSASWNSVAEADRYVVGMADGSQVELTATSIGTAVLRPVWVYAVNYNISSAKSYF